MNVCTESALIKEKTAKKLEITYYQNRFKLKEMKFQVDGAKKQQILLIN